MLIEQGFCKSQVAGLIPVASLVNWGYSFNSDMGLKLRSILSYDEVGFSNSKE